MKNNDTILIYGFSTVIESILLKMDPEKDISLIIVDDKRNEHIKRMINKLSKKGI